MTLRLSWILSVASIGALHLAATAHAVDGVLEINQACAMNGGCFTGDAAGFPVTIANPGSYRLTGNLSVADNSADAITVTGDQVTLDLNGFELVGPNAGTGRGIGVDGDQLAVRDGAVREFGAQGIQGLGRGARVEDVRVLSNLGNGIELGAGAQVSRCQVRSNGGHGVVVGDIGQGAVDSVSLVEDCAIRDSFGNGLMLINADARRNRVDYNRQIGIVADGIGLIAENHIEFNGVTLPLPFAGGIATGSALSAHHLRIRDNVLMRNGEDNIRIESSGNVIEGNSMNGDGSTNFGIRFTTGGNFWADNRCTSHAMSCFGLTGGLTDGGGNTAY